MHPKVTILMSVFNGQSFVQNALASILNQSFRDFELLVFEDGSTDCTLEILKSFQDPRIKLHVNAHNQGLTKNLAAGMEKARGEYIARMDADDICLPDRIQSQVDVLTNNSNISILGSSVIFFDDHGHEFIGYQPTDHDVIKCELLYGFTMLHPSIMLRKGDLERHGLRYDPYFTCSQDHDLWVRASRLLTLANIRKPLLKMREHPQKIGRKLSDKQRQYSDQIRARQLDELGLQYTNEELKIFNLGARGEIPNATIHDFAIYDGIIGKIAEVNESKRIFHQTALEKIGAAKLRGLCRSALIAGNCAGQYYWRSKSRAADSATLREQFGLIFRTLFQNHNRGNRTHLKHRHFKPL